MGMRATAAVILRDGTVRATTLQWSTMLDLSLASFMAQYENAEEGGRMVVNALRNLTRRYGHVSAFEFVEGRHTKGMVPVAPHLMASYPQAEKFGAPEATQEAISKWHLDDGLGVIHEAGIQGLTFFYEGADGKTVFTFVSFEDLYQGALVEGYHRGLSGGDTRLRGLQEQFREFSQRAELEAQADTHAEALVS